MCFFHQWSLYLRLLGKGVELKTTSLLVFFLWLVKSLKNLWIMGLLVTWGNVAFFLISSMVLGLPDEVQIYSLWYLIEFVELLTGLGLLGLWHLIYTRLLTEFGMLVYFTSLGFSGISSQMLGLISSFLSSGWLRVDGKSSQEFPVGTGVPQGPIRGPTLFLLYINDLPDSVIHGVGIYADDTTLCSWCDQASDLWQQLELASELESDLQGTVDWVEKWLVDFNARKTQLVSVDWSNSNGSIGVKMDGSVQQGKLSFKMLGLTFSSKLNWGSHIISIAKTVSKKIGASFHSIKFLSLEVALYLYKSTICPCMEYCCHVWAGAPSCYFELLDKLLKWICRTVGPSLDASLESLAHRRNLASLSLFYRYYFGRCSSELAQLISIPFSGGKSTRCSDRLHDFSVTSSRCYKDAYVNNLFPHTARAWNSLSLDCFPLTYDLSGFKSTINGRLLNIGSF